MAQDGGIVVGGVGKRLGRNLKSRWKYRLTGSGSGCESGLEVEVEVKFQVEVEIKADRGLTSTWKSRWK
jgi:hypothetical protein